LEIYDRDKEYTVLPESMGANLAAFPGRKVIFNKDFYYGMQLFRGCYDAFDAYANNSVPGVFAMSEHNVNQLKLWFEAKIFGMFFHIDSDIFAFTPLCRKQQVIACVAKEKEQLTILQQMTLARCRGVLNVMSRYRWILLKGFNETEMAQVLQSALITISMSAKEGLGRTLLEAMACGSLPMGLSVGALKESLPQQCQFDPEDFFALIKRIEEITGGFPDNTVRWQPLAESGRTIAEAYTYNRQKEHLLDAWGQIMAL
jgi:hypothetical protein